MNVYFYLLLHLTVLKLIQKYYWDDESVNCLEGNAQK